MKIVETILTAKIEKAAQVETLLELPKQLIAGTLGVEVDDEVGLRKCLNAK